MKGQNRRPEPNYVTLVGPLGKDKQTTEHFIIECEEYRRPRQELDREVAETIGRDEWERRKEEDRGRTAALGLTYDRQKT